MSSTAGLTTLIAIDSADRNQINYPNPADYVYKLPQSIRNAETIELMMFQMTRAEYNVNSGNNTFLLNNTTTVTIPESNYSNISDLINAIQISLNAVSSGFTVTSTLNMIHIEKGSSFNITINSSTARLFGLYAQYQPNGVSNVIGTERGAGMCKSTYNNSIHSIVGTKLPDLNGEPYVILSLNDYLPNISVSSTVLNGFVIIPLEMQTVGSRFSVSNDFKEKKGVFKLGPSQTKIDQIKIRILRSDGSLYDFKGSDHQIVLRIMRKDNQNFNS
jgi:hypothetical protein